MSYLPIPTDVRISTSRTAAAWLAFAALSLLGGCGGSGQTVDDGDCCDPVLVSAPTFDLLYASSNGSATTYTALDSSTLGLITTIASGAGVQPLGDGSQVLFRGEVMADGTLTQLRAIQLLYLYQGALTKQGVGEDLGLGPTTISSENTAQVCSQDLVTLDFSADDQALLFYVTPGADGQCSTADDQFKVVHLSDPPSTAPTVLPTQLTIIGRFYSSQGKFESLLALSGTDLVEVQADLSQTVLLDNVASVPCVQIGFTSALVEVLGTGSATASIYSVGSNGSISSALYQAASNETLNGCTGNASEGWFASTTAKSTLGPITTAAGTTKIFMLPLDGSSAATTLTSLSDSTSITKIALTASKIVFVDVDFSTSSSGSSFKLLSTDNYDSSGVQTLVSESGSTPLSIDQVANSKVYYRMTDSSGTPTENIIDDNGADGATFGTPSVVQFQGNTTQFGYPQYDDPPYGFLTSGYTPSTGDGGTLSSISTATGTATMLFSIPSNASIEATGFGPRGLIDVVTVDDADTTNVQSDVYAYGLDQNFFERVTNTPGVYNQALESASD